MAALAHKLELDLTLRNYDREQLVADAENKARLAAIGRDERLKDVWRCPERAKNFWPNVSAGDYFVTAPAARLLRQMKY